MLHTHSLRPHRSKPTHDQRYLLDIFGTVIHRRIIQRLIQQRQHLYYISLEQRIHAAAVGGGPPLHRHPADGSLVIFEHTQVLLDTSPNLRFAEYLSEYLYHVVH